MELSSLSVASPKDVGRGAADYWYVHLYDISQHPLVASIGNGWFLPISDTLPRRMQSCNMLVIIRTNISIDIPYGLIACVVSG